MTRSAKLEAQDWAAQNSWVGERRLDCKAQQQSNGSIFPCCGNPVTEFYQITYLSRRNDSAANGPARAGAYAAWHGQLRYHSGSCLMSLANLGAAPAAERGRYCGRSQSVPFKALPDRTWSGRELASVQRIRSSSTCCGRADQEAVLAATSGIVTSAHLTHPCPLSLSGALLTRCTRVRPVPA